jgi:hypothetical protein
MKVMVIGGVAVEKAIPEYASELERLSEASRQIGQSLIHGGHQLVVCSPFPDSADFHALKGATENPKHGQVTTVHLFYPAERSVTEAFATLKDQRPGTDFIEYACAGPMDSHSKESWKNAWLLAQLSAMEHADIVLAIGGRPDGAMSFLLPLAEMRNKPILPFAFLGGLSTQMLDKKLPFYRERLGSRFNFLLTHDGAAYAGSVCESIATRAKFVSNPKFFLSYAKARPTEADFLEMILRRRNFTVFRDDGEFAAGVPVHSQIIDYIDHSDVFLAVWCQQYACSPWCFDELEYALARERMGSLSIWIVPVDETRIVPPGARDKLRFDVYSSREQLEGRLMKEIDKITRLPSDV